MIKNDLFINEKPLAPQVAGGMVTFDNEAAANSFHYGSVGDPCSAAMDFLDPFVARMMPLSLTFPFSFRVCGSTLTLIVSMSRFYLWLLVLVFVSRVISVPPPREVVLALSRVIVKSHPAKATTLSVFLRSKIARPISLNTLRMVFGPLFSVVPFAPLAGVTNWLGSFAANTAFGPSLFYHTFRKTGAYTRTTWA